MDNFLNGFNAAIQDLKGNWVPEDWSNSAIKAQVESADNYHEHYVQGYMCAIAQFRSLPV